MEIVRVYDGDETFKDEDALSMSIKTLLQLPVSAYDLPLLFSIIFSSTIKSLVITRQHQNQFAISIQQPFNVQCSYQWTIKSVCYDGQVFELSEILFIISKIVQTPIGEFIGVKNNFNNIIIVKMCENDIVKIWMP